jgi:hypothetical protein
MGFGKRRREVDGGAQLHQRLGRAAGGAQYVAQLEGGLRILRLQVARAAIGRDRSVEPPVDLQREAEIAIGAARLLDGDGTLEQCDAAGDVAALTADDAAQVEHGSVARLAREDSFVELFGGREFFGLVVPDRALEIAPEAGLVVARGHLGIGPPREYCGTISPRGWGQPASFRRGNLGSKRERNTAASSGSAKQ